MERKKLTSEETRLAQILREEILKSSQKEVKAPLKTDIKELELISSSEKGYVSPIFSMSQDEILAFVEEFEIEELATLEEAELNHIVKTLGFDPISVEGAD